MAKKPTSKKKPAKKAKPSAKKPSAKRTTKAAKKAPSSSAIASFVGAKLAKKLETKEIQKLRKRLPGYTSILDDVADQLKVDGALLNVPGATPKRLNQLHSEVKIAEAQETVLLEVYRAVYERRLKLDDEGMDLLRKLERRINAMTDNDPGLPKRWNFLIDYLDQFKGGGRPPENEAPEVPPSPPA